MKKKWNVYTKGNNDLVKELSTQFDISPYLARILINRDVATPEEVAYFLQGTLEDLHDPTLMKDMEKAVALIATYLKEKKRIRIIGDYDVDGVCSTFILKKGFQLVSEAPETIDYVIPHRVKDGYGLNIALIQDAIDAGVEVIVTCDNGIAAANQIAFAKEHGLEVIVTDHHEVPYDEVGGKRVYKLPPADAIVDPKQEDCTYPFPGICGAVIAYKLIQQLYKTVPPIYNLPDVTNPTGRYARYLKSKEVIAARQMALDLYVASGITPRDKILASEFLHLAAMATVCDVMELKDENHIIVKCGLATMRQTSNLGLGQLIKANKLKGPLNAGHMGFRIGPCFNAAGRLETASIVMDLLEETNYAKAAIKATQLIELNEERQDQTQKGLELALAQVEEHYKEDMVIVVYLPEVHESLAGIIAGKVREAYNKPVFVLTDGVASEEDTTACLKGSGRSIEAYHMYDEMTKVKDLFLKYGGHKMAAGLSMAANNLEAFRRRLNENSTLTEDDLVEKVMIDIPMPVDHLTMEFVQELSLLEPYGNGNPHPVFGQTGGIKIEHPKLLGKNSNVLKGNVTCVTAEGKKWNIDAIRFQDVEELYDILNNSDEPLLALYEPQINTFQDRPSIQIVIKDYQVPEKS